MPVNMGWVSTMSKQLDLKRGFHPRRNMAQARECHQKSGSIVYFLEKSPELKPGILKLCMNCAKTEHISMFQLMKVV